MSIPQGATPIYDPSLMAEPVELEIIDASADPGYAAARSAEALSSINHHPEIAPTPDGLVHLPAGWIDPAGKLHRTAQVRELTGAHEEALSRVNLFTAAPQWLRVLMECGVESIGPHPWQPEMLNSMLVGDREQIALGIRIATYGDDLPMDVACPVCGEEQAVVVELGADVPVKELDPPEVREFDVELKNGRKAVAMLPTAALQDILMDGTKRTSAEMASITLEHCVRSIDGNPVNHKTMLDMAAADRKTIMTRLGEIQPGPNYEGVSLPCSGCARKFPVRLSLADLFRS